MTLKPGVKIFLSLAVIAAVIASAWYFKKTSIDIRPPPPVEVTHRLLGKTEAAIQAALDKKFKAGDTRAAVEAFLVDEGRAAVLLMPNFSGDGTKIGYIFGWEKGHEIYIEAEYQGDVLQKKLWAYSARGEPH